MPKKDRTPKYFKAKFGRKKSCYEIIKEKCSYNEDIKIIDVDLLFCYYIEFVNVTMCITFDGSYMCIS